MRTRGPSHASCARATPPPVVHRPSGHRHSGLWRLWMSRSQVLAHTRRAKPTSVPMAAPQYPRFVQLSCPPSGARCARGTAVCHPNARAIESRGARGSRRQGGGAPTNGVCATPRCATTAHLEAVHSGARSVRAASAARRRTPRVGQFPIQSFTLDGSSIVACHARAAAGHLATSPVGAPWPWPIPDRPTRAAAGASGGPHPPFND